MTKEQFGEMADKIEAIYRPICPGGFTDIQLEEWWDSFGGEDYEIIIRALKIMKDGGHSMNAYAYFPIPSTFWCYINRIKEVDVSKREAEQKPKESPRTPEDLDRHKRWMRFIWWIKEEGVNLQSKPTEEVFEMKAKFEKEHPDWERKKKVPTKSPETIGQIIGHT